MTHTRQPGSSAPSRPAPGQDSAAPTRRPGARSPSRSPDRLERLPITTLRGVGPQVAAKLQALGVTTVGDLLFHLPQRYEDRTRVSAIGALREGDEIGVCGEVELTQVTFGKKRALVSRITDGTGSLHLRFFHFSDAQKNRLERGARMHCYGEVRRGYGYKGLEMVHPEYRILGRDEPVPTEDRLTPIYPSTEGITQALWRRLMAQALTRLKGPSGVVDYLLDFLPHGHDPRNPAWPSLHEAVLALHEPPVATGDATDTLTRYRNRLALEELVAHHLSLRRLRQRLNRVPAPVLDGSASELSRRFVAELPFLLTPAQSRVVREIQEDLAQAHPMHRLVQGDVGSGKTVVAALATLAAIGAGYQAAFMAPTELLAEQHLLTFCDWFGPLGIEVVWLSGKLNPRRRREARDRLADPAPKLAVGTHALFQDDVTFGRLGLTVVDEQHRFGVHQRLALLNKGRDPDSSSADIPHQLIMTATPIPRTLAMSAYADLDTSIIDELPPGRQPIDTVAIASHRRSEVVQRVRAACNDGRQAYWVCPLIDESELLNSEAAVDTHAKLCAALPGLEVGLVHGRMRADDKTRVMRAFKDAQVHVLVATTVIEVGVDVPNATLMILDNAERLGLAQLHQLRGRVGRGAGKSVCLMMYEAPLSEAAHARLQVMRNTSDGFKIAEEDLRLRGPGEVLGTRQTGLTHMRVADLMRDKTLLPQVREIASKLMRKSTDATDGVIQRWVGDTLHYGGV